MYFSGTSNNYKSKIKSKKITSTTPNTKISQNQGKIRKLHRTPINNLNKSQNITITKKSFQTKIKNVRNNPIQINAKKIFPVQNIKNINFMHKNKNLKIHPLLCNNRSSSKTNSLSNYYTKTTNKIEHNLRKNYSNTNIINITNTNTTNFNEYIKNNFFYHGKPNVSNYKKNSLTKIKDILNTEDLSLSKNLSKNSTLYPLVITEESKKNLNENNEKFKIKKNESNFNTYIKKFPSITKLKNNSTTILNKQSLILNNQNKLGISPIIINNQTENLSSEKNSQNAYLDTFENKIINEIKEFKNYKNNEIIDKLKSLFDEALEYIVQKELQNIFLKLLKEIFNINKNYIDNISHLKEINDKYKIKLSHIEKRYRDLINILKNKESEINRLKKEIEKISKEKKQFINLKIDKSSGGIDKQKLKRKIYSVDSKKDNNLFIKKLNAKNVDDLDALYFLDKVNYIQNDVDEIPKLNLQQKYIEKCIKNEIIKRNEVKLTPFQKIALQFELPDS